MSLNFPELIMKTAINLLFPAWLFFVSLAAVSEPAFCKENPAQENSGPVSGILVSQKHGQDSLVQWHDFSKELFDRASKENKLLILDLEAVWCHWCHVMDQKTYSNVEVAKVLKEHYISMKVDQDARPDLSNRYEDYGWPATIIFNAKGQELAKRSGYIEPEEMLSLLSGLVKKPLPEEKNSKKEEKFSKEAFLPEKVFKELDSNHRKFYDEKDGGWQTAHKFVDADSIEYALCLAKRGNKPEAEMAKQTLSAGLKLIDPVWGGVYQYSTKGSWDNAHFEKIMSVQSDNLRVYSLAYLHFKDKRFLDASKSIESYLRKFLLSPEGAFYTSQDADLKQGEHSGEYFKLSDSERRKLGIPRIDKNIYARENGWAILGIVSLYMASGEQSYLDEAVKAASYIEKNRSMAGGGFRHAGKDAGGPYLSDTLSMARAYLALYQATGDRSYLKKAEAAAAFIKSHFANDPRKAGFLTADPESAVLAKPEPLMDENIALARFANLLFHYSGNKAYKAMAESSMRYLASPQIYKQRKMLVGGILLSNQELSSEPAHITVLGAKSDPQAKSLFQAANRYDYSYKRVEWLDKKEGKLPNSNTEFPDLQKAAAFACANNRCSLPAYKPEQIAQRVDKAMGF